MSKAGEFINDCTRNCSNYTGVINKKTYEGYYVPWLTPDQARKAVEIAREELLEEICVWLHHNADIYGDSLMQHYNDDRMIEDLKQAIKDEKI